MRGVLFFERENNLQMAGNQFSREGKGGRKKFLIQTSRDGDWEFQTKGPLESKGRSGKAFFRGSPLVRKVRLREAQRGETVG